MIRRLFFLTAIALGVIAYNKAKAKRDALPVTDSEARSTWESEGGTPAPEGL